MQYVHLQGSLTRKSSFILIAGYITSTTAAASQTDRNLHVLDTVSLSLSGSVHAYVSLWMAANIPVCKDRRD